MEDTLSNITQVFQNFFVDKDIVKEDMTSVPLDVDYHEGGYWGVAPLFFKDLVNYQMLTPDLLKIISTLKDLNVISAVITEFGKDCSVLEHSDADLIKSPFIMRALIPLEPDYYYKFSGCYYKNGTTVENENFFRNEALVFVPTLDHSFKNMNSHSQFFIIADICTDNSKLTKEFWDSYLYFSISNYIK